MAVTLNDYKWALHNAEKTLKQEKLKSCELWQQIKRMEQEQKDTPAERGLLYKTTNEVITNAVSKTPKMSKLTNRKVESFKLAFSGLQ